MADNYDLSNLTLDDNTIEVLPDGDYHFTVDSHEVGFSSSEKLPPNTQQVTAYLDIPVIKDGAVAHVSVRHYLNIHKKALFAVRQFVECIGMVPEKGRLNVDLNKMDKLSGICSLSTIESKNGNEYNRVQTCYPPSKAPAVCANDDAWAKKDDFMDLGGLEDELPFV